MSFSKGNLPKWLGKYIENNKYKCAAANRQTSLFEFRLSKKGEVFSIISSYFYLIEESTIRVTSYYLLFNATERFMAGNMKGKVHKSDSCTVIFI